MRHVNYFILIILFLFLPQHGNCQYFDKLHNSIGPYVKLTGGEKTSGEDFGNFIKPDSEDYIKIESGYQAFGIYYERRFSNPNNSINIQMGMAQGSYDYFKRSTVRKDSIIEDSLWDWKNYEIDETDIKNEYEAILASFIVKKGWTLVGAKNSSKVQRGNIVYLYGGTPFYWDFYFFAGVDILYCLENTYESPVTIYPCFGAGMDFMYKRITWSLDYPMSYMFQKQPQTEFEENKFLNYINLLFSIGINF